MAPLYAPNLANTGNPTRWQKPLLEDPGSAGVPILPPMLAQFEARDWPANGDLNMSKLDMSKTQTQFTASRLYYYTDDWVLYGWAATAQDFRSRYNRPRNAGRPVRVIPVDTTALPDGYRRTGSLANDPIERVPGMKQFVKALIP